MTNKANIQRVMPSNIWTGTGFPPFSGTVITGSSKTRDKIRVLRRSKSWLVRIKFRSTTPDQEWHDKSNAYQVKARGYWEYDYYFHNKGEALMFMLKCE